MDSRFGGLFGWGVRGIACVDTYLPLQKVWLYMIEIRLWTEDSMVILAVVYVRGILRWPIGYQSASSWKLVEDGGNQAVDRRFGGLFGCGVSGIFCVDTNLPLHKVWLYMMEIRLWTEDSMGILTEVYVRGILCWPVGYQPAFP